MIVNQGEGKEDTQIGRELRWPRRNQSDASCLDSESSDSIEVIHFDATAYDATEPVLCDVNKFT
jgi:hypothetical protein